VALTFRYMSVATTLLYAWKARNLLIRLGKVAQQSRTDRERHEALSTGCNDHLTTNDLIDRSAMLCHSARTSEKRVAYHLPVGCPFFNGTVLSHLAQWAFKGTFFKKRTPSEQVNLLDEHSISPWHQSLGLGTNSMSLSVPCKYLPVIENNHC
jgi:hypothetical protein